MIKNNDILFSSAIISSERYRALKKYRYGLYFLLLFLVGSGIQTCTHGGTCVRLIDVLHINVGVYLFFLAVALISTGLLYYYSKQVEILGGITINEEGVIIDENDISKEYLFNELTELLIERRATYHREYKQNNYLRQEDNWLVFKYENEQKKLEFVIDSAIKNKDFEQMIRILRAKRVRFKYLSI